MTHMDYICDSRCQVAIIYDMPNALRSFIRETLVLLEADFIRQLPDTGIQITFLTVAKRGPALTPQLVLRSRKGADIPTLITRPYVKDEESSSGMARGGCCGRPG